MRIYNIQPNPTGSILARFDLEIDLGLRIYGVELRRNAAGSLRVYAPAPHSVRIVTFEIGFAEQIIKMAQAEIGGPSAYENTTTHSAAA